LGGAAGEAAEQLGEKFLTKTRPVGTSGEAAAEIGWEFVKQGAYELGGRAIAAVGGRAITRVLGKKAPKVGETIKGLVMPESLGQAYGKPGGFTQTAEHYIGRTFLGSALKRLRVAQENVSRQILAKLSGVEGAVPEEVAVNWAKAREATRAVAQPIYESFGEVEAKKDVAKVAVNILRDQNLRLSSKAVTALEKIASDPIDEIAKGLGYQDAQHATARMGKNVFDQYAKRIVEETGVATAPRATVADAVQARHELGDLAAHARDPNDRRLFFEAWKEVNAAIDKNLTPEQQELKREADRLWRRSYIMDRISRSLEKVEATQDPKAAPKLAAASFAKLVNGLAKEAVGRDPTGRLVRRASELDVLFDSSADRKAIVDLASFLSSKYQSMSGSAGMGESIARVGIALEALRVPYLVATGQHRQAEKEAGYL